MSVSHRIFVGVALAGLVALNLGCSRSASPRSGVQDEFKMDKVCATSPYLHIHRVARTATATTVDMTFQSDKTAGEEATPIIYTDAPGTPAAFYIAGADKTKKYKLLAVSGLPTTPHWTNPHAGEPVHFTLTFEPIPDTLKTVDIAEGAAPESASLQSSRSSAWTFQNVALN